MVFEFIFPYNSWNSAFFTSKEREIIQEIGLLEEEAVVIFEYEKNNKS